MKQNPSEGEDKDKDINKHYFHIDVSSLYSFDSFSEWIKTLIDHTKYDVQNIVGFPVFSLPVTDLNPIYGGNTIKSIPLYLGNNQYNESIYKAKHFIADNLKIEYLNHLKSHAIHFVQQPNYYKGLFDILN